MSQAALPGKTEDDKIKLATKILAQKEEANCERYLEKNKIPGLILVLYERYVFAMVGGVFVVLDRQARDSFGDLIGLAPVSLSELKKYYVHLLVWVDGKVVHLLDLIAQSALRDLRELVVRPEGQAVAEDELNLLQSLPVKPQPADCSVFGDVLSMALEPNGAPAFEWFLKFLAHGAYPRQPGLGAGVELRGGLDTPFGDLFIDFARRGFGPRCVVITHPDQFAQIYTRLSRPSLVIVTDKALDLAGRAGEKCLLECVTHRELPIKGLGSKEVTVPNYTQAILLSELGYEPPKSVRKLLALFEVHDVPDQDVQAAREELFECGGLAGVIESFRTLDYDAAEFHKGVATAAHGISQLHGNLVLLFLLQMINNGALDSDEAGSQQGKQVMKGDLFKLFDDFVVKTCGMRNEYNAITFGRELNRWLPVRNSKLRATKKVPLNPFMPDGDFTEVFTGYFPCHVFPPVEECKRILSAKLGMDMEWKNDPVVKAEAQPDQPSQYLEDPGYSSLTADELDKMLKQPMKLENQEAA
jgi:hypothetical protein